MPPRRYLQDVRLFLRKVAARMPPRRYLQENAASSVSARMLPLRYLQHIDGESLKPDEQLHFHIAEGEGVVTP
jgi:hypothetical protein